MKQTPTPPSRAEMKYSPTRWFGQALGKSAHEELQTVQPFLRPFEEPRDPRDQAGVKKAKLKSMTLQGGVKKYAKITTLTWHVGNKCHPF